MDKSLKGAIETLTFYHKGIQKADWPTFCSDLKSIITKYLLKQTSGSLGVKWYTAATIRFFRIVMKDDNTEEKVTSESHVSSTSKVRLPGDSFEDLEETINEAYFRMYHNMDS